MNTKRISLLLGVIIFVLTFATLPFISACSTATTTTATTATSTTTAAKTTTIKTPDQTSTSAVTNAKTLKIGYIGWLGFTVGVSTQKSLNLMSEMINDQGGLDVGGEKYNIQLIFYDSNNDQATSTAALNRLIFEDNVKFIVSDHFGYVDSLIPITEANKVILCAFSPTNPLLLPTNHYCFQTASSNSQSIVNTAWFVQNYPDKKNFVFVAPDNMIGNQLADQAVGVLKGFGLNAEEMLYPANQTDLSSIGTKIKMMNPDVVECMEALPYKAIYESGWRGQFFFGSVQSTEYLLSMGLADALDGYFGGASITEFDPALTDKAQEFKSAYIAQYGRWDDPDMPDVPAFVCITEAISQAGSLDTDKVADIIGGGLTFEHPAGTTKMVGRPDLNNDRGVDSVCIGYIKTIEDGKPKLFTTIPIEDAANYFQNYLLSLTK